MKSLNLKSTSVLAIALIASGVVATATPVSAEQTTGTVEFTAGNLEFGDGTGQKVPSFDFGQQDITAKDKTYDAVTAGTLKVSDLRGTGEGWYVTVTQSTQLKTTNNDELTGAQLTLDAGTTFNSSSEIVTATPATLTVGNASKVFDAQVNNGNGFSTLTYAPNQAHLEVPGRTAKKSEAYTAELVWTLTDSPDVS